MASIPQRPHQRDKLKEHGKALPAHYWQVKEAVLLQTPRNKLQNWILQLCSPFAILLVSAAAESVGSLKDSGQRE